MCIYMLLLLFSAINILCTWLMIYQSDQHASVNLAGTFKVMLQILASVWVQVVMTS